MSKILLTGCAGFIASRTGQLLLDSGHKVIGVDNLNDYYDIRLKNFRLNQLKQNGNFSFIQVDIESKEELRPLFEKFDLDVVLNLAARAGVRYSMENPFVYMSTNAMGSLNLMDLMREFGVSKYLLASTSSLYAGQPMPYVETLPVNTPISPYAASKKSAEMMAHAYHHLYDLDVSIVRYFTVYGPAGRPDMSVFRFIKWIDEGTPIEIFGDGLQSRDFTFVDDIARGTIAAMRPLGFEIINLGGGNKPVSLKTVIEQLEEMLGKTATIEYKDFHKADVQSTWADISKAKRLLDWQPQTELTEGLEESVRWYIENQPLAGDIVLP